jgi:ATP-dependent DNA helicase UvrD/PcrA
MHDELLADLTEEQREAVTTRATPLCILAGAGSGKTRVLTRRIAWQGEQGHIDPRRALAVTFTRKAANELRARLRALGQRDTAAAGTFHAIALAQLHRHWAERGHGARQVLDSRIGFVARQFPFLDRPGRAELSAEIGWARARLITPESYAEAAASSGRRPVLGPKRITKLYAEYEKAKRHRRLIDFDDVLALCHETLKRDAEFGAAQRWRYRHLFIDEFQDVNPLQFALLRAWLGDESTLVVVGDPDQAIYAWNGADPDFIVDVTRHLPGCAVISLRTNFRSSPEILAAAGRLMEREPQPAVRSPGPAPTVTIIDGDEEPAVIARAVRACHRPGSVWRHQAILARTNAQLSTIVLALERQGIPVASGGEFDLLRRPEIETLIHERQRETLRTFVADTRVEELELSREQEATVESFLAVARDHADLDPSATLGSFLAGLRSGDRSARSSDGIVVTTFHGAKGLEWPIVHLIGLEKGLVPIAHARTAAARAEERRLLHVAVTRAERELHLYWCSSRLLGDSVADREPSPWLEMIESVDQRADPIDPMHGVATVRGLLGAVGADSRSAADGARLRLAFEDWRRRIARQSRIEPTAVVSDLVLDELVARRPLDLTDLAEVDGLAPGHARRWGQELVDIVEAHAGS